jgi:hypothetical protein
VFAQDYPGTGGRGLDAEVGPWTIAGTRAAYFVGTCPACTVGATFGTVSLSVTKDGGRGFLHYNVSALAGYGPTRIRVSGDEVTIWGKRLVRKLNSPPFEVYARKVVTLRVA